MTPETLTLRKHTGTDAQQLYLHRTAISRQLGGWYTAELNHRREEEEEGSKTMTKGTLNVKIKQKVQKLNMENSNGLNTETWPKKKEPLGTSKTTENWEQD